jgi:hypothetical protein
MTKPVLLCLFIVGLVMVTWSQSESSLRQLLNPESIVLHLDQHTKVSGEILWFKLYLRNTPYLPEELSTIAYVELLNSERKILTRLKIRCSDGIGYGQIALPEYLRTGYYYVAGYTLWMENFNRAGSFMGKVYIRNRQDIESRGPDSTFLKRHVEDNSLQNEIVIHTNKSKYQTREQVNLDLEFPISLESRKINYSISVYEVTEIENKKNYEFPPVVNYIEAPHKIQKEKYIHPVHPGTLKRIDFSKSLETTRDTSYHRPVKISEHERDLLRRVSTSYPINDQIGNATFINTPSDLTYKIKDYEPLPDFREFIKEIVHCVKIKEKKKDGGIRILNSENDQNVHFFSGQPLLLVNNYIVDSIELILKIPIENVASVDVTWKSLTLNRTQIIKLADNGIFSVKTNRPLPFEDRLNNIYEGFHTPHSFNPVIKVGGTTKDVIPDFRTLLFWSPLEKAEKRPNNFTFFSSDREGRYRVEIVGLTDRGNLISSYRDIEVCFCR